MSPRSDFTQSDDPGVRSGFQIHLLKVIVSTFPEKTNANEQYPSQIGQVKFLLKCQESKTQVCHASVVLPLM